MDIKEKILTEAVNRLNALGARFHIRTAEGFEVTSQLPLFEPPPEKKRTRTSRPDLPSNREYIKALVKDMVPGGSPVVLTMQDGDEITRFARNVCAFCSQHWGTGDQYATETNKKDNTVTLYRF